MKSVVVSYKNGRTVYYSNVKEIKHSTVNPGFIIIKRITDDIIIREVKIVINLDAVTSVTIEEGYYGNKDNQKED